MKGFAKYKQNIDSILENSYEDKDKFKNNLSVIMGAMKFSKSLREFFVLYNEIESKKFESQNESRDYITEAVNHLKENKSGLKDIVNLLDKVIKDRKEFCTESTNIIYHNIDSMVFGGVLNLEETIKSRKFLTESMVGEYKKPIVMEADSKILSQVISKKYQEEYGTNLNESERSILKNTLVMTEDTLNTEYDNVKGITLNTLNSMIGESKDETLSAKLTEVKNEVLTLKKSKSSYIRVRGLLEDLN
jgi:hypothetical protein|tara:strand:- start:1064 stop:1804 length:741 start_codon:yes stop_codon:yes gene_type:complete